MRPWIRLSITSLLAASAAAAAPAAALAVTVHMDENTVVDLSAPAGNVVVANPSIADVNLITPRRMVILGRSYGVTNIIVTDRTGRTIMQQEVNVAAAPTGRVSVYKGPLVVNFACSPHCERTPMPGEERSAYEAYSATYKDYDERARASAAGQGGNGSP